MIWEMANLLCHMADPITGHGALFFVLPKQRMEFLIFTNADEGYKVYEKLILQYLGNKEEEL